MLLPKTVRLDDSDLSVFPLAAESGEWAIPGTFVFANDDPEDLGGKRLQAFRQGFLGIGSFGWSTLVEIDEIGADELARVEQRLADWFVEAFGAPDRETALPAARDEVRFASELCEHPAGTLLAIEREFEALRIVERFRAIQASALDHSRIRLWGPAEEDAASDQDRRD